MKNDILYSPWRLKYILSEKEGKCIFCDRTSKEEDEKHFILHRSVHCFVIMNMYPYNNGHLMVVPYNHTSSLTDLSKEEVDDVFETVQECESILRKVYNPEGINIGMNIGKAAGAGIDEHIHVHILPRWSGDVNFFSVIGGTRVVPESFERAYFALKEQFDNGKA
jgi:ATP adenylyltransferase